MASSSRNTKRRRMLIINFYKWLAVDEQWWVWEVTPLAAYKCVFGHTLLMCKILFKNIEIASKIKKWENVCLLLKNQEVHGKSGSAFPQSKSCRKPGCSRPLSTVMHSPLCCHLVKPSGLPAPLTSLTCGHAGMWDVFAQLREQAGWKRWLMKRKKGDWWGKILMGVQWVWRGLGDLAWPKRPLPKYES